MSREIIIVGCGPTCAFCDFDAEVWGVNSVARWPSRLDKLFFFDNIEDFNPLIMTIVDVAKCFQRKTEIITTQRNAQYAKKFGIECKVYPLMDVIDKLGSSYFSNTIAYELAYALYLGDVTKIRMYGVDHMTNQTYVMERSNLEYWIGRAVERGVKIEIPTESALLKTQDGKLYGYDQFFDSVKSTWDEVIVA